MGDRRASDVVIARHRHSPRQELWPRQVDGSARASRAVGGLEDRDHVATVAYVRLGLLAGGDAADEMLDLDAERLGRHDAWREHVPAPGLQLELAEPGLVARDAF